MDGLEQGFFFFQNLISANNFGFCSVLEKAKKMKLQNFLFASEDHVISDMGSMFERSSEGHWENI